MYNRLASDIECSTGPKTMTPCYSLVHLRLRCTNASCYVTKRFIAMILKAVISFEARDPTSLEKIIWRSVTEHSVSTCYIEQ